MENHKIKSTLRGIITGLVFTLVLSWLAQRIMISMESKYWIILAASFSLIFALLFNFKKETQSIKRISGIAMLTLIIIFFIFSIVLVWAFSV